MNNKTFISIPCWRDPFAYETIKSAYDNAYDKESLRFGVLFQGYQEDSWMLDRIRELPKEVNVKINSIDVSQTPPYLCEIKQMAIDTMMEDESYYLQIDSHTKFKKNWDVLVKAELLLANRVFGKSIINQQTVYFDRWDKPFMDTNLTSYADNEEWNWIADTLQFSEPIALNGRVTRKPSNLMIKEKFFNGNFVFAYSYYTKEVPFPKRMAQCFEQQMMAVRAWTAGYNIVSPIGQYSNNFDYWSNNDNRDSFVRYVRWDTDEQKAIYNKANAESLERYKSIFDTHGSGMYNPEFGAFKKRSVQEYINFIDYDPITLKINNAPRVDLKNAEFISNDDFESAIKEILYMSGYSETSTEKIR